MNEARILIVSPVHNEAAHIERVARGVAAQELPPARWIVVDDNSKDDTLAILRRLEREIPFMTVVERSALPEGPVRDPARHALDVGGLVVDRRDDQDARFVHAATSRGRATGTSTYSRCQSSSISSA